jgi:putative protein kinase ArgK-like GTPase of G3E family
VKLQDLLIIIETVGVGQSRPHVLAAPVVLFTLKFLVLAMNHRNTRLEMTNTTVINKTNGDNINRAKLAKPNLTELYAYVSC